MQKNNKRNVVGLIFEQERYKIEAYLEIGKTTYAQRDYLKKASYKGRNLKIGKDYELHNYLEEKNTKKEIFSRFCLSTHKKENKTFKTHISVPTLYRYIYSGIFLHLHSKDLIYGHYKLKKAPKRVICYKNPFAKRIDERKDEINNRSEFGHWKWI